MLLSQTTGLVSSGVDGDSFGSQARCLLLRLPTASLSNWACDHHGRLHICACLDFIKTPNYFIGANQALIGQYPSALTDKTTQVAVRVICQRLLPSSPAAEVNQASRAPTRARMSRSLRSLRQESDVSGKTVVMAGWCRRVD